MRRILINAAVLLVGAVATLSAQGNGMKDKMTDGMKDQMKSEMMAPLHGMFAGVDGHAASGGVTVTSDHDKVTIALDTAFAAEGESLELYLSSDGMRDMGAVKVGRIRKSSGAQTLTVKVPAELHARYVLVWSTKANVAVAKAMLDDSMMK